MKLVFLPGLGADARLFEAQRRAFPTLEVPRWLAPPDQEPLERFAARMASGVAPDAVLYLGGVSFGGMVALEMARHLRPRGVFLIGSCSNPGELPTYTRFLGRALRIFPARISKAPDKIRPLLRLKFGAATKEHEELLFQMLLDTPISFLRWGCRAILDWKPAGPPPVPVWRIHGAADHLIPASLVRADRVVEGAGHLVNLTHPQEVERFIREHVS